jgi:hypothetical protein
MPLLPDNFLSHSATDPVKKVPFKALAKNELCREKSSIYLHVEFSRAVFCELLLLGRTVFSFSYANVNLQ